ncbi:MAG: hypothetical protein QOI31_1731 [Solirubrobacterales bacterium]|jgi:hypothetical protein|nr:hypothetical protein [Solirubrobacterales bacterium]
MLATQAIIEEQYQDRLTLPTWLIVDTRGGELVRNAIFLDGPTADAAVAADLTQRDSHPRAAAMALVRVDDSDLRILAWDLATDTRVVARPVIEAGRIRDWRRGWFTEFDSTPRGGAEPGATLAYFHTDQTSLEETSAQLEQLATQTLKFFLDQALPGAEGLDTIPDITGVYNDRGMVSVSIAQPAVAEAATSLGHVLNDIRQQVAEADNPNAVHIFHWPRRQVGLDEMRLVIAGCDRRYDSVFASEIVILALGTEISFDSIDSIPLAQLERMLDEAKEKTSETESER